MKNLYYKLGAGLSVLSLTLLPKGASAQLSEAQGSLDQIGGELGGETELPALVGNFINVFLSVLGIIFVILIVYAGFLYMTAGGSEDNVKKAKKLLSQSIIGLIIIVTAYAISNFVIDALVTATQ